MGKGKVCVLVGATASGKTSIGVRIAKQLNGEIISADSMQIYQLMNIGTAKPSLSEQDGVPHHLIDRVPPDSTYSVAQFVDDAEEKIKNIFDRGKMPIIVGGTGLYINGLTLPWGFQGESKNQDIRTELETLADQKGNQFLYEELKKVDPDAAEIIHPNNVKRVIRALEIYQVTGKTKTQWDAEAQEIPTEYDYRLAGLMWDRSVLYDRIDRRVDQMMADGLLDEIKMLTAKGYGENCQSMKALGYKEFFPYLKGEIDLDETVRILKRDTRHFAKRQLTWFRKDERIRWFDCASFDDQSSLCQVIIDYYEINKKI